MSFAPLVLRWLLAPGASLAPTGATDLVLTTPAGDTVTLTPGHAGLRDALLALGNGADEAGLLALAGDEGADRLHYYLIRMAGRGLLEVSADLEDAPVVRLLPHNEEFALPQPAELPDRVVLDRFAYLRRDSRGATLQHPDAVCDLLIEHPAAAAVVARLASGPMQSSGVVDRLEVAVTALLVALGFTADAAAVEDSSRRTWEFHDRLFHRAARNYDDILRPHGATLRFAGILPAPPAIRPHLAGTPIALPAPPAAPAPDARSLHGVMERRRSRYDMSDTPVDLVVVSALLHRVARVTEILAASAEMPVDALVRPYPSAGGIYELEFYLAVRACAGLAPGFYHYRGQEHALTWIAGAEEPAAAMVEDCAIAWGQPARPPQVLVVIASRLPRLAWKYSGIAYKLSLLNAGVAIQSLYLVATDLGLAGAAAGSGNPALFARATGVSSWEETSIAEFGFGRPA